MPTDADTIDDLRRQLHAVTCARDAVTLRLMLVQELLRTATVDGLPSRALLIETLVNDTLEIWG